MEVISDGAIAELATGGNIRLNDFADPPNHRITNFWSKTASHILG